MRFFIPRIGPENAEVFYTGIRAVLADEWGYLLTARRVHRLSYTSNGQRQDAVVGKQIGSGHQTVFAIFETSDAYLVCTPQHGVTSGQPVLVKRKHVVELIDFDPAEAQQPA